MPVYMIVEDDTSKAAAYRKFQLHYRSRGVEFRTMDGAHAAITTLADPDERAEFDGVIADFALGAGPSRPDNWYKRIDVEGPDGGTYSVSNGLGVLDWIHGVEPSMNLWALTNDAAGHAPLFMSAARLWLNAKPLSLTRLNSPGSALGDRLLEELLTPAKFSTLNPAWRRVDEASSALAVLLDTEYSGVEAFDWLHALTSLRGLHRGLIPALNDRIQSITQRPALKAYANTLAPEMAQWQLELEDIYKGFPDMREKDRWPKLDPERLPTALNAWPDFNPITDFLGSHSECREFFAAEDVRVALVKWRRLRQKR